MGAPVQFHPGPQVGDQHAGDPQEASATGESWATAIGAAGNADRPRGVRTVLRAEPGTRVRNPSASSRRRLWKATEVLLRPQPLVIFPDGGRVGVAGGEVPDEGQDPDLPRGQRPVVSGACAGSQPVGAVSGLHPVMPPGLWSGIALRR